MIWLLGIGLSLALPEPQALLQAVDQNLSYQNRSAQVRMTVQRPRRDVVYTLDSMTINRETAMEFLSPARDKGTKMLRKDEQLWVFFPQMEKTQRISGHMLQQGVMGSAVSYHDLTEVTSLEDLYAVVSLTEDNFNSRACYRLVLQAKSESTAYQKRIAWIDQEWLIPHKEEYYAVSGKLLKTMSLVEHSAIEGRNVATKMIVQDALQPTLHTVLEFSEVSFSVSGQDDRMQLRWLER